MSDPIRIGERCTLPLRDGGDADRDVRHDGADVIIYGKDGCPHTRRAREALPGATFIDVLADPVRLEEMLALSGGVRRVPVIVRAEAGGRSVEVGFKRGA